MTQSSQEHREHEHVLPRWVVWMQDHLFMSFLIMAEAYILGMILVTGLVSNIEDPGSWGFLGTAGVAVFFSVAAAGGGVAIRCAVSAAAAFRSRQWGFAAINTFGMAIFAIIEIWSSLAERSQNLKPTPADIAVLAAFNIHDPAVSITVVMIALFVPSVLFFWGFSQSSPPKVAVEVEDTEQLQKRLRNEELIALHQKRMAGIRGETIGNALGGVFGKNNGTDDQGSVERAVDAAAVTPAPALFLVPNNSPAPQEVPAPGDAPFGDDQGSGDEGDGRGENKAPILPRPGKTASPNGGNGRSVGKKVTNESDLIKVRLTGALGDLRKQQTPITVDALCQSLRCSQQELMESIEKVYNHEVGKLVGGQEITDVNLQALFGLLGTVRV